LKVKWTEISVGIGIEILPNKRSWLYQIVMWIVSYYYYKVKIEKRGISRIGWLSVLELNLPNVQRI
jgi:hypothetical protein